MRTHRRRHDEGTGSRRDRSATADDATSAGSYCAGSDRRWSRTHRTRRCGGQSRPASLDRRVERHRSRQVIERQVQPGACADQVLDLRIRLRAGEVRSSSMNTISGTEPQRPRDFARHQFGDQRLGPARRPGTSSRTAHRHRLRQSPGATALAQRRNIASDADRPQGEHALILARPGDRIVRGRETRAPAGWCRRGP